MGTMVFTVLMFCSWFHPVHVSLLNVDLDLQTGKIEIVFKFDKNDFETIIMHKYNVSLDLKNKDNLTSNFESALNYIDDSFKMGINGTIIEQWEYTGNEVSEESIWLYYRKLYPEKIRDISITNAVLMDLYEDQTNLVILTWSGKQNGYQLDNKKRNISLVIE